MLSSPAAALLSLGPAPAEATPPLARRLGRRPMAIARVVVPAGASSSFRQGRAIARHAAARTQHMVSGDGDAAIVGKEEEASSFEPSMWRDFFINYELKPLQRSEEWMMERADQLKEEVHTLFDQTCNNDDDLVAKMQLLDAVQRLGISHLFREEMSSTLSEINASEFSSSSLHEVALRFRLLREHGFWVSSDVFNRFKGDNGRFMDSIAADEPRGLLSLYNAAHLLVHDEPELEEAISFARRHLTTMIDHPPAAAAGLIIDQVNRALEVPLPRTYKRVEMLHYYMLEYGEEEGHIPALLELAKLDFNLMQHVHLKELKVISEWWKDLYGYMGLNYVRDRAVESYVWSYVASYEEGSALTRMIFAKIIAFIILMDDTYDAHATIHECRKLNEAIQRWDESAIPLLPEYMKKFYSALLKNFKEFETQVEVVDGENRIDCAKKEFQKLSACYLQEAEWSHEKYKPRFEEQLALSTMTSTVPLLCVSTTVGRGDALTKEAFKWISSGDNDCVIACAKITRFMNDIASFKRGKNKGDMASTVECYMSDRKVRSELAIDEIDSMVEDAWRTINQARRDHPELIPALQQVVNLAICATFFYGNGKDAYTFSTHLERTVESLFVTPLPL
ncbi:hypothetical protein GUJ93_ZPchr0004g38674 [Zizania palustris]|uniref:Uncharacterized protein n=1 Tax=Zizania palustris TaxID=103762 RepID=A0A8J5S050_ZIZPA|nr:hypothetical protein GUJ93_ZPchr0004g38674 [Zizania palustris]